MQAWQMQLKVDTICNVAGNLTIRMFGEYNGKRTPFEFSAIVALDSVCAETLVDVPMDATMTAYSDQNFSNEFVKKLVFSQDLLVERRSVAQGCSGGGKAAFP